jgi:putative hydrolase of the HAD superfamily
MLKAIFFDLDGTLCRFQGNFKEIFIQCCSPIFEPHKSLTYDVILDHWNKTLSKEGELSASIALQKVCSELMIPLPANYPEIADLFCQTYASYIAPIQGIKEMLKALSDQYKLAIISNGPTDMQNAAIDTLGIRSYFETILISGDPKIQYRKPNPLIFQLALDRTKTRSEETLMIGDNIKVDIEGAKDIGLHTLFIGKNEDANVKTIDNILYLRDILERDFGHSMLTNQ